MAYLDRITPSFLPPAEQDHIRYIGEAIKVALSPWDPGKMTVYYTDHSAGDFHPFEPVLTIEIELLPRLPFSTVVDVLQNDMHTALLKVADRAFEWYRYRHAVPINNPNIILGEE